MLFPKNTALPRQSLSLMTKFLHLRPSKSIPPAFHISLQCTNINNSQNKSFHWSSGTGSLCLHLSSKQPHLLLSENLSKDIKYISVFHVDLMWYAFNVSIIFVSALKMNTVSALGLSQNGQLKMCCVCHTVCLVFIYDFITLKKYRKVEQKGQSNDDSQSTTQEREPCFTV